MDPKLNSFIEYMKIKINKAKASIEKFAQALVKNPVDELGSSTTQFENAAAIYVLGTVLEAIKDKKVTFESLQAYVLERVLTGAGYYTKSTSPTKNMMDLEVTAQWAALYDQMKWNAPSFSRR